MISTADVKRLAELARISMTEAEAGRFAGEIESILGYVAHVQEATGELGEPTAEALHTVLRPDGEPHPAGLHSKALLAAAPAREGDYIQVQRILEK